MDDKRIIELFWARSEQAITETANKYQKQLCFLSYNILGDKEDSEECANDTYLRAWNSIPPKRPECLRGFLLKIARNLSLNKLKLYTAQKRGGGQTELALCELEECVSSDISVEEEAEAHFLKEAINQFLAELPKKARIIFVRRYFYLCSVADIAKGLSLTESDVKSTLFRARNKLKLHLEKEGVFI